MSELEPISTSAMYACEIAKLNATIARLTDAPTMPCLVCGQPMRSIHSGELGFDAWHGGGTHEFIPGFGSRHDMTTFVIALCDACIDLKVAAGAMLVKARPSHA